MKVQLPPSAMTRTTPAVYSLRDFLNPRTVTAIWFLGVAAVLLRHFWANLSLRRQLSLGSRRAGKRTEEMVADCAWRMGLNPIAVFEADHIPGPALFGIWRPLLLFPSGLAEKLSDGELRLVVLHEMGHLKRRDLPLQCLLILAQAVHWFNPLAWLAVRLARVDRELACDEFVMARSSDAGEDAYAKTLLRVLSLSRPGRLMLPAVGIIETKNKLKQRIIMIQNYKTTNLSRQILGAISILAVSVGLLTANAQNTATVSPKNTETSAEAANEQVKADNYAQRILGRWLGSRKFVIFHEDGQWGVQRNEEAKEEIMGRRWRIDGKKLFLTYPIDKGDGIPVHMMTSVYDIISFTQQKFITEIDGFKDEYERAP